MDLRVNIEAVRAALIGSGGTLNPPATGAEIAGTEEKLGVRLPLALQELYRAFNGSLTPTEQGLWNFWSLAELDFASNPGQWGQHLVFCDALIWAPAYSFRLEPHHPGALEVWGIVSEDYRYRCCSSVARFLERFPGEMDFTLFDEEPE